MRHATRRGSGLRALAGLGRDVLDLLIPRDCAGCGEAACDLCPACVASLLASPFRHRPQPCPPGLPPLVAASTYAGTAQRAIIAWKERGLRALATPLGGALAAAIECGVRDRGIRGELLIVPIPASRAAVRSRGEDVLVRVAREAVTSLRSGGIEARVSPVLHLARSPRDQAGLDARQRRVNLAGAMRAGSGLSGLPIVVVDDVVTTGATLAEAARALADAARPPLLAATIAATTRRGIA